MNMCLGNLHSGIDMCCFDCVSLYILLAHRAYINLFFSEAPNSSFVMNHSTICYRERQQRGPVGSTWGATGRRR